MAEMSLSSARLLAGCSPDVHDALDALSHRGEQTRDATHGRVDDEAWIAGVRNVDRARDIDDRVDVLGGGVVRAGLGISFSSPRRYDSVGWVETTASETGQSLRPLSSTHSRHVGHHDDLDAGRQRLDVLPLLLGADSRSHEESSLIEGVHDVRADEARGAGDEDGGSDGDCAHVVRKSW